MDLFLEKVVYLWSGLHAVIYVLAAGFSLSVPCITLFGPQGDKICSFGKLWLVSELAI